MASTIWIKSRKWTRNELEGTLVEFDIAYSQARAEGVGEFLVRGNGVEKMAIDIVVPHPSEFYDTLYHLPDSLAEKIEVHPDQAKARYRVEGRFE
jgi:hypothetical protein